MIKTKKQFEFNHRDDHPRCVIEQQKRKQVHDGGSKTREPVWWYKKLLARPQDEIQAIIILGCGGCVKFGSCDHKDADTEHVTKAAACSDFELPALVNDGGERISQAVNEVAFNLRSNPLVSEVHIRTPQQGAVKSLHI